VCAQGYEGGGHTGEVGTMVLIPKVVDLCRGHKSPLTGEPIYVVAAGGIYDGRTMAAALSLGADAVWVGTRFLASHEATATELHKRKLLEAQSDDTVRSEIYTGRPARVYRTP
jgi:NAD(P)H-dependent flavin oxidoreductase YrpB (nitropropane dioxygenase family)